MHKWGRKELRAKINADPAAESSAGWWMEETEKHTHKVEERSGLYRIKHPGERYLSKLQRQEHCKCEKAGGKTKGRAR